MGQTSLLHLSRAINLDAESSLAISRGKSPLAIREHAMKRPSAVTSSSNNTFKCSKCHPKGPVPVPLGKLLTALKKSSAFKEKDDPNAGIDPKLSIRLECFDDSLGCFCLSVYLSMCLSVYLSVCPSVCLYICLSVCPSVMSICISVCPSVCLSICQIFIFHTYELLQAIETKIHYISIRPTQVSKKLST